MRRMRRKHWARAITATHGQGKETVIFVSWLRQLAASTRGRGCNPPLCHSGWKRPTARLAASGSYVIRE